MRARLAAFVTGAHVALWASAAPARAAPDIAVDVDCPALDADARAAFEARARTDLALQRAPEGRVVVTCSDDAALLAWLPADGAPRRARVASPAPGASAVDPLLDALHAFFVEEPAPPPSHQVAPHVSRLEDAPAPPGDAPRWLLLAGARAELWAGGIGAALGGDAGVAFAPSDAWRVSILAGPTFGATGASGFHAFSVRAAAMLDRALVRHVDVGVGAAARVVGASGPAPAFSPSLEDALSGGAVLHAAYRADLGPLDVSFGPQLEWLVRPVIVQANGQEVFRVPTFVASFDVDAGALLAGARR